MKVWLLILAAIVAPAIASNVYIFDPNSNPVPNRGIAYIESADTLRYMGQTNVLFNVSLPTNRESLWLTKMSNGVVMLIKPSEYVAITNWQATNGVAIARSAAVTVYDDQGSFGRVLNAIMEATVDELNRLRTNQAIGLPSITYQQARTVITNKVVNDP